MEQQIASELYIQKYMFVWNVNLKLRNKMANVDICTPPFCLKSTENKNKNWIRLDKIRNEILIKSNFSTIKELKRCTTYMIDPVANTVLNVYEGFAGFPWNKNEWRQKMRFVFELEIQSATSADPPIIWKRCTTEMKPPVNNNGILLSLESETAEHTDLNNQGVSCVIERFINANKDYAYTIAPENSTGNWELFTEILKKVENNVFELCYVHTSIPYSARSNSKFYPLIILEINELTTSLENMSEIEIATVKNIIKPTNDNQKLLQLNMSSSPILMDFFTANKLCDITVQVKDQQIRAHNVVLANGSIIWRELFFEDETLSTIIINDFDYETIKELIEYMYTGNIKLATDQLLIAADKYGVVGLKKLCEEQLIQTIAMKTVVNLLVLAYRYNARVLFDKAAAYIQDHIAGFMKLEGAKAMFMMYPELAFKLFELIL